MYKYTVIINAISDEQTINNIELLEKQKYNPLDYVIVTNNDISAKLISYFNTLTTGLRWRIKVPLPDESTPSIIDECFKLNTIKSRFCLYLDQDRVYNIDDNLSEQIDKILEKKLWYYKINNMIFFPTVLCKYFVFEKLEEKLIASGYATKIYDEYSNTG